MLIATGPAVAPCRPALVHHVRYTPQELTPEVKPMHILIRSLGLALVLLLLAGCEVPQSMVGFPPAPEPALPPMPEDPYGLDHPPMAAWDFYREWLEDPAAAHHTYRGRTVTLAYARGLVPSEGFPMAALQAPKFLGTAEERRERIAQIERGDLRGIGNPLGVGWGPWTTAWHRPAVGRDFQLWCDNGQSLWHWDTTYFVLEHGITFDEMRSGIVELDERDARAEAARVAKETWEPMLRADPELADIAAKWNNRVYTVHARVLGHVVGYAPHNVDSYWVDSYDFLHVMLDNCSIELMDITAVELDAWFDFDRAQREDPESAPYRPLTLDDQVVPVAEPLRRPSVDEWMNNIVGVTPDGQYYVIQEGLHSFHTVPVTEFTELRPDASPLPEIEVRRSEAWTSVLGDERHWDSLDTLDRLRQNWLRAEEGPCGYQFQEGVEYNWPECVPEARRVWMSNPDNLESWKRIGGD